MLATRTKKRPEIAGLNPLPRMTPHTLRRTYISIMLLASGRSTPSSARHATRS
jgi:integrase